MIAKTAAEIQNIENFLDLCSSKREFGSFKFFFEMYVTEEECEIYKKYLQRCERTGMDFCFAVVKLEENKLLISGYSNFEIHPIRNIVLFDMMMFAEEHDSFGSVDIIFADNVERASYLLIAEPFKKNSK